MSVKERLEKLGIIGIVLFIVVVLLLGVVMIQLSIHNLEPPASLVVTTIGATLIGVGLVDLVSEVFIKPSTIGKMRDVLKEYISEPTTLPKKMRMELVRSFVEACTPSPQLSNEIVQLFDEIFLSQLTNTYREDCRIALKLRKMTISGTELAEVSLNINYKVHNLTNRVYPYKIPFYSRTENFSDKGVPIEDHIKLEKIGVSGQSGMSIDLGDPIRAYAVRPEANPQFPKKVEFRLPQSPSTDIPARSFVTILIKYTLLCDLSDDYAQRMAELTRNMTLEVDFLEDEFEIDVSQFCLPEFTEIEPTKIYEWLGWFVPYHGFAVGWKST